MISSIFRKATLVFWLVGLLPLLCLAQQQSPQSTPAYLRDSISGISNATETEEAYFDPSFQLDEGFTLWKFLLILAFLAIGFLLSYLLDYAFVRWARQSKQPDRISSFAPVAKLGIWVLLGIILVVEVLRPHALSLLAFWLSLGLALAFAAQELLKSTLGGLLLLAEKPFQKGDKVSIGTISGVVTAIHLRTTHLRTAEDTLLSVPNSGLLQQQISNATSGESHTQVVAELFLPLHTDTIRARQIALEAAHVSRYIYQNKPISVYFENRVVQEKSWLVLRLKAYALDLAHELDFRSETTELMLRELHREGLLK